MRWIFALLLFLAAGSAAGQEPRPPFFTPRDCDAGTELPDGITVECGVVTVLENRDRPDGPRIGFSVATLWRTGQDIAPDPLLFIQGGPGLMTHLEPEGLQVWAGLVKAHDWLGRRRLVLFDQRGTGVSPIPGTPCPVFDTYAADRVIDHLQPSDDVWLASFRRNAKACWAAFRQAGHDPNQTTTAAIAADVSDLRRALGYASWNLWGLSFGSRVALTVMRDHPDGVRSVIVEGVLPPDIDPYGKAANLGMAFDALVRDCRADEECDADFPDLERRFLALAARLDETPETLPVTLADSRTVQVRFDGWTLRDLVFQMLADGDRARFLPLLVAEAEAGTVRRLANMKAWQSLVSEFEQQDLAYPVHLSILCADLLPTDSGWADRAGAADRRFADQVWDPRASGYCDSWPVAPSPAGAAAPVTSTIPTLLISGDFDPVTPASWAETAARRLANGYSYVFPGRGHGVLIRGQPCARRIAARFLDDPAHRPDDPCVTVLTPPFFEPSEQWQTRRP
jgi:pimeloyl-ACP methyl ester carboxylesterase